MKIDAINEITFANEHDYREYLAFAGRADIRQQIIADENSFIEPDSIQAFLVDEVVTPRRR